VEPPRRRFARVRREALGDSNAGGFVWRALNTWIHGGSSFVAFVCEVAILVTVASR
jgi:hypothetical protein